MDAPRFEFLTFGDGGICLREEINRRKVWSAMLKHGDNYTEIHVDRHFLPKSYEEMYRYLNALFYQFETAVNILMEEGAAHELNSGGTEAGTQDT